MESVRRIEGKKRFNADVVVCDPDGVSLELIAEVKECPVNDSQVASEELRQVMLWTNCHNGLLVTPDLVYVYRDSFEGSTPDAIRLVGSPLRTDAVIGQFAANRNLNQHANLKSAVVSWLEALSTNWFNALPADSDVANAFLPEAVADVAQGIVRLDEVIFHA